MRRLRRRLVFRDPEVSELFADEPELVAIVDALAQTQRRRRRGGRRRAGLVAIAAATIVVVSVVLPLREGDASLIAAARAAVADGRVVHVVSSRLDGGDELIDLRSGRARPTLIEVETWFDEDAARLRTLTRRQGAVVADAVGDAAAAPEGVELTPLVFARGYRASLERGGPELRRGRVGDDDVAWVELDVSGTRYEVAIDTGSHLPRRYRRRGSDVIWTVRETDARPLRAVDFRERLTPAVHTAGDVAGAASTPVAAAARRLPGFVWAGQGVGGRRLVDVRLEQLVKRGAASIARSNGIRLLYGGPVRAGGVEVRQAGSPEPAYGWAESRRTLSFNPIPPVGQLDLVAPNRGGTVWTGQLRVGVVYVTIRGTGRSAVTSIAHGLRPYE